MHTLEKNKPILELDNISFAYPKNQKAIKNFSISVQAGSITCLLGRNGSFKTTLLKILSSMLKPDDGKVLYMGENIENDLSSFRFVKGMIFQSSGLDESLSVKENIQHYAYLYGIYGSSFQKKSERLLQEFNLESRSNDRVAILSGGMKRKVEIIKILLVEPTVLILDEPSVGLDIQSRMDLWNMFHHLKKQKKSIILTSHFIEEAKQSDYICILQDDAHVFGPPSEVLKNYQNMIITIHSKNAKQLAQLIQKEMQLNMFVSENEIKIQNDKQNILSQKLIENFSTQFSSIAIGNPTLEDFYICYTQQSAL